MAKIKLELVGDVSNLLGETDLGVDGMKKLAAQGKVTRDSLKKDFTDAGKSTKEFNTAIDSTVKALADEGKVVEAMILKFGGATKAQRAMKKELDDLAAAGKQNTKEFRDLQKVAAELKDTLDDTRGSVKKLSSDTAAFDKIAEGGRAMAAGFSVAAGASALLGNENEDLQKSIQKSQAAMSLLLGVQEVAKIATEKGGIATGFATAAQGAYATVLGLVTGELTVATVAQKTFSAAIAFSPIGAILLTITAVAAGYKLYSDKQALAKQEFEDYVKEVEAGEEMIRAALEKSNQERQNSISLLTAQKAGAKAIHDAEIDQIKNQIASNEKLLVIMKEIDTGRVRKKFNSADSGSEEEKALAEQLDANTKAMDKLELETDNLHAQLTIKNAAYHTKTIEDERAYQKALFDLQQRAAKEAEIFQTGEEKIKTEERLGLASLTQLRLQLEQQNIELGRARKLDKDQEEQFAILKDVIFKKAADDRLALYSQEQKDIDALQADGRQKELDAVDLKYTELRAKFKDNANALKQLELNQATELAAVETKFNLSNLEANKQHQLSLIDQQLRGGQSEIGFEKQKAQQKLAILIQYNSDEIAILEAQIPFLSEEAAKSARAQVDALKKGIVDAQNELSKVPKVSLAKLIFGDDPKAEENLNNLKAAISDVLKVASDANDTQIENNQKLIDSINKKISTQEDVVRREEELQKKGLANSVASEKRRLDALHKQASDAVDKQRELAKKKQAIDAVTQSISLITASAEIIASQAGGGPVGIAIAVVTIAAMFAAFAAAQVKASEAINAGGFKEGGYTGDGDPSETSTAIGKRPYKYHKKEFVMNEELTSAHRDFFEALHKGDKQGIIFGIGDLLKDTGVVLPDRELPQKLFTQKETHDRITSDENNYELKMMREELVSIKEELKQWHNEPKETVSSHGDDLISIKGNRKVITRKTK